MPAMGGNGTVLVFRVSLLVALWLALIGSISTSIKFAAKHKPPRAGQKDPSARGKFRKRSRGSFDIFVFSFQ